MGAAGVISVDALAAQLGALGVRPGDAVMAHVAMRDLVPVERGTAGAITALREAVGPKGTLLFAIPCDNAGSVFQAGDRIKVAKKVANAPGFDPMTARPRGILGDFAAAVLADPGMTIAPHPAMRYAGSGRHAAKLLGKIPWDDPMGPGSPVDLLGAFQGKVLVAGAESWMVTAAHLAEYYARPRGRARVARHYKTIEDGKPVFRTVHMIDDSESEARHDRAFSTAQAQRFARTGSLGRGRATLYDSGTLVRFLAARLAGPDLFRTVLRVGGPPPEAR
jgi:aminoglycoside 3-N-acetyltransferase